MIKIEKVNKYYNKGKANQIHVIDNTTMTLPDKGIVCLLGPSGCGKTTLLNAIGGLDKVNSGTITIDGQRITRFSSSKIDSIRNARIGYIFQNFNLLDDRTVFENVAIALRMIGIRDNTTVTARVRYCLEKVGIDQYRNKLAGSLSGGQRQRLALARALLHDSPIYIFDEATSNIDMESEEIILERIREMAGHKTVTLLTQRLATVRGADRIFVMENGKVAESGSHRELMKWGGAYSVMWRMQQKLERFGRDEDSGEEWLTGEIEKIGDTGELANTGRIGNTARIGDTGAIGNTGRIGNTARIGSTGAIGSTGPISSTGPIGGSTGPIGNEGKEGDRNA